MNESTHEQDGSRRRAGDERRTTGRRGIAFAAAVAFALTVVALAPGSAEAQEGRGCSAFNNCPRGYSCGLDFKCHRPTPPVVRREGAQCFPVTAPCASGFNCGDDFRCHAPRTLGQSCGPMYGCAGRLVCGADLTCHNPGPRRAGEACTPGIEPCGPGLNCGGIPGRCVAPGEVGAVCDISRPCRSGLNCASGIPQLCQRPGIIGQACDVTRSCGNGLSCSVIGSQGLFKCTQDRLDMNSSQPCGFLYAQGASDLAREAGSAFTWGAGGSMVLGGPTGTLETGVAYGPQGQFGCYATVCAGLAAPGATISAYVAAGIYTGWERIAGLSYNANEAVTASRALTAFVSIGPGFNISQIFDPNRGLIGTTAGFSMNLGVSVIPVVDFGAAACCTVVAERGATINSLQQGVADCRTQAVNHLTQLGTMFQNLVRGRPPTAGIPSAGDRPVDAVPTAPVGQAVVGSIGMGSTVSGSVSASTPVFEGRPTVFYNFQCTAGQSVQLTVTSSWDNVAFITDMAGNRQAYSDDANGTNAQINWSCPATGSYRAGAGAYNAANAGGFTMSLQGSGGAPAPQPRPQPSSGGGQAVVGSISIGATVGGTIDGGTPQYSNRPAVFYNFQCSGGQPLRLNVNSTFDNVGYITDMDGNQLAFNDDANGTNAQLDWTCPASATFRAGAGAYSATNTGAFTLSLQAAGGAPPPQPAPQPQPSPGGGQAVVGSMSIGATVGGTIDGGTPLFANRRSLFYNFQCFGGQALRLNVNASYDNVAFVTDLAGNQLAFNDDANGSVNAQIDWTCPSSGTYRAGAGSYSSGVGPFTMSLQSAGGAPAPQPQPSAPSGSQSVVGSLTLGATVGGNLDGNGAQYAGRPAVFYNFQCAGGQSLQLNVNSQFDNVAFITDLGGNQLAFNDDANGTLNAQLNWVCPSSGTYRAGAGALRSGLGGPFTLRITSGGRRSAAPDSRRGDLALGSLDDGLACRVPPPAPAVTAATTCSAAGQCPTAPARPGAVGRLRVMVGALLGDD